ncbi:SpsE Sialic acid synthase [Methylophilaceae bacterium]
MNYFSTLQQSFIIAEIGVNHNGDINLAKKLIEAAKSAGADAVKFQTFTAASLVSPDTPKVHYQLNTSSIDETHYEMLKRLELSKKDHFDLATYCQKLEIDFISTPYDIQSAAFLAEMNVPFFKTASADLVDIPLQRYIAATGKPTMIATGMASIGEVERVVNIYEEADNSNIVLLHAVSNYPCSDESLNMRAMSTLAQSFYLPVGFSDHSVGHLAAVISIAMGAKVIEKHFTLDKSMTGPDHRASSTPLEFSELVLNVRRAERMLGCARKICQPEERQMAAVSRKSLTLARDLKAGDVLLDVDVQLMRPGTGVGAIFIDKFLGQSVRTDLRAGHQLRWSDIEGFR